MDAVSSRHEGDLGGRLASIDEVRPLSISIEIAEEVAGLPAVQQAAWMTLNILARLERVVGRVVVSCPAKTRLLARCGPRLTDGTLGGLLRDWSEAIATVPVGFGETSAVDLRLAVGPGPALLGGLRLHGEGWSGGFSSSAIPASRSSSALPFGPYMAAALATGEVFKRARIDPARHPFTAAAFYDLWSHAGSTTLGSEGPPELAALMIDETLVGVGAVGCISSMTLWATDGISGRVGLIDGDEKGIDKTNLNRYLLFTKAQLGQQKASSCSQLLDDGAISWAPQDVHFEFADLAGCKRILCAVDGNVGRVAVQSRWPESLMMASTHELRSELVRCDPRAGGPCARCYNDPEVTTSDDQLRQRFREASVDEQAALAAEVGADLEEARRWAERGECGTSGERVRDALRRQHDQPLAAFAVPFASCAAGVMLAAEVVKEALDAPVPLSPKLPRAAIQFWRPERSKGASPYTRDPRCPMCEPRTDAAVIWRDRMAVTPLRGLADHPSQ